MLDWQMAGNDDLLAEHRGEAVMRLDRPGKRLDPERDSAAWAASNMA